MDDVSHNGDDECGGGFRLGDHFLDPFKKRNDGDDEKPADIFPLYELGTREALGFAMIDSLQTTAPVPYTDLADEDLLRACANSRDSELWGEFFARFYQLIAVAVYRATTMRGGGVPTAVLADLTQDTCAKIFDPTRKVLARFEPRHSGAVKGFLRAVTMHLVIDYLRADGRERSRVVTSPNVAGDDVSVAPDRTLGTVSAIELSVLQQKIDRILVEWDIPTARRDRDIFWYHYQHGMSAREISEVLGIGLSVKGVETALLRAVTLVRKKLKNPGKSQDFLTAGSL